MGILLRIILFFVSILIILKSVFAVLVGLKIVSESFVVYWVGQLYQLNDLRIVIVVGGILFLAVGVYLFYRSINVKNKQKPAKYYVSETGAGQLRISVDAIEGIVLNSIKTVAGIKEPKVRAQFSADQQAIIKVSALIGGERPIPEITEEIQVLVREELEEIAGVKLASVEIAISDIADNK